MLKCNTKENCYNFVETFKTNNMKKSLWDQIPNHNKVKLIEAAKEYDSVFNLIETLRKKFYPTDLTVAEAGQLSLYAEISFDLTPIYTYFGL